MPTRCCSEYIFRGFYWRVGGGGEGFRGSEIAAKKEERTRKKKTVLGRSFTPDEGKQIARTRLEVFHESHPFFLSLSLSLSFIPGRVRDPIRCISTMKTISFRWIDLQPASALENPGGWLAFPPLGGPGADPLAGRSCWRRLDRHSN